MVPGEILTKDEDILLNAGVETIRLTVANSGDRPIQVGSHYHFAETNEHLKLVKDIGKKEKKIKGIKRSKKEQVRSKNKK